MFGLELIFLLITAALALFAVDVNIDERETDEDDRIS